MSMVIDDIKVFSMKELGRERIECDEGASLEVCTGFGCSNTGKDPDKIFVTLDIEDYYEDSVQFRFTPDEFKRFVLQCVRYAESGLHKDCEILNTKLEQAREDVETARKQVCCMLRCTEQELTKKYEHYFSDSMDVEGLWAIRWHEHYEGRIKELEAKLKAQSSSAVAVRMAEFKGIVNECTVLEWSSQKPDIIGVQQLIYNDGHLSWRWVWQPGMVPFVFTGVEGHYRLVFNNLPQVDAFTSR